MSSKGKKESILEGIEDDALREQVVAGWKKEDTAHFKNRYNGESNPVMTTRTHPDDPAQALLLSPEAKSIPVVYREYCYICNDREFAMMGMPLCSKCPKCEDGHVPADDPVCDDCGYDLQYDEYPPEDEEEEPWDF